jgi:outer membrane protein OmpA-like peptidoglycan-associated protein
MRKVIVLLFLIAGAGFLSQIEAQTFGGDSKESRKRAVEHLKYDEYEKAIPYLKNLVKEEPANAYYNFWLGKCLYYSYKKNMALVYLDKAASIDPEISDDFHFVYALALHYNFKFDEAKREYYKALEKLTAGSQEYLYLQTCIAQCDYGKRAMNEPPVDHDLIRIRNAGEMINTPYAEHSPVVSGDESVMIFTARRPECLGAMPEQNYYDEDVYISFRDGELWTKSQNIGMPVNSKGHDATISLTADGRTLYIYRHKEGGGLYVTDFDTSGQNWKDPVKVERPFNSKYYEACVCVSPDGLSLIFSSDRPNGFGGRDLYMVERQEQGGWSEPKNLGPNINTAWDEDAPFIHPDGKTLYYSSNGPTSMGGFDIFVSELNAATKTWLPALNMGFPVNTPDEDIYFVLSEDGLTGYYSSGKEGGFGEKDIYYIDFPYYPYPRRYNSLILNGLVLDADSHDTLPAVVRLLDKTTGEVVTRKVNRFNPYIFHFDLKPNREYSIEVIQEGYPFYTENLSSPPLEGKDVKITREIELRKTKPTIVSNDEPIEIDNLRWPNGRPLEVMNIYYDFDKYNLRKESKMELDSVIAILDAYPDLSVELHGHTDWYNNVPYNDELSLNRCRFPYNYLVDKGVDPNRIYNLPLSENRPLETNENDEGRQYNRRCEFHFVREGKEVYSSLKLRSGMEGVYVDHAPPKGLPGFDRPELVKFLSDADVSNASQPEPRHAEATQDDTQPMLAENVRPFRLNVRLVSW